MRLALVLILLVHSCMGQYFGYFDTLRQAISQPFFSRPTICHPGVPCDGGFCCLRNFHGKCYHDITTGSDTCLSDMTGRCALNGDCTGSEQCVGARSNMWGHCRGDPCATNVCNGGTCTPRGRHFDCECPADKKGTTCDQTHECSLAPTPCGDNGNCIRTANDGWRCNCGPSWTGKACNIATLPPGHPCGNPGTCNAAKGRCVPLPYNGFSCYCITPWTGSRCDIDSSDSVATNPCEATPCKNSPRQCIPGFGDAFTCHCSPGFIGATCEDNHQCTSANPCQNSATCAPGNTAEEYTCTCAGNWVGPTCEIAKPAKPTLVMDTSHPTDGDTVVLSCTTTTVGVTHMEFRIGSTVIATVLTDSTSAAYAIIDAAIGTDDIEYNCVACVDAGLSEPSDDLDLMLYPKTPTLTVSDSADIIETGSEFEFTCATTSVTSHPITYTFFKDATEILGSAGVSPTYTIDTSAMSNSGTYTCTATIKGTSSEKSAAQEVEFCDPPDTPTLIAIYDTDQTWISLSCISKTSHAARTFEFFRDDVRLAAAAASSYTIDLATIATHNGMYTCKVMKNTIMSDSSPEISIKLTPKKPTLSVSPSTAIINVNTATWFKCVTTSSGPAVKYEWFKDGSLSAIHTSTSGNWDFPAAIADSGAYTCKATIDGKISSASNSVGISVKGKPATPTLTITNGNAVDGTANVQLECVSTTADIVSYEYFKNGLTSVGELITAATIDSDNGVYTCKATKDGITSDASPGVTVQLVPQTPTLTVSPSATSILSTTETTFTCVTDSSATPVTYEWFKDNAAVSGSATSSQTTFTINAIAASQSGSYTCKATIDGGVSSASAAVTVDVVELLPCMSGWEDSGSWCYSVDISNDGTARSQNFIGGNFNCRALHASTHLTRIDSQEENDRVLKVRKDFYDADSSGDPELDRAGLHLQCDDNVWKWDNNGDTLSSTWSNWDAAEPKICGCAFIYASSGKWRTSDCTESGMTICQIERYAHYCTEGCENGDDPSTVADHYLNNGVCTYTGSGTEFSCKCPEGLHGIKCEKSCGGKRNMGASYSIAESDWPSGATCVWYGTLPFPQVAVMKMSGSLDCAKDSLKVYQVSTANGNELADICTDFATATGDFSGIQVESTLTGLTKMIIVLETTSPTGSLSFELGL